MSVQGIGLIGQVRKRIIDLHIAYFESCTNGWLIDPYFFLVCRIPVIKRLLKIVYATSDKKNVIVRKFQPGFRINTNRIGTDHRISFPVKRYVKISLCKQTHFLVNWKIIAETGDQLWRR